MKSLLHVVIVAIAIACGVVEMPAQVSIRNKPRVVPGEVIVKYKSDTPQTMVISSLASAGVVNIQSSPNLPFLVGKVASGKKLEEVLRVCQAQSNVEYAEPNYRVYALEMLQIPPVIPNDPRFNELWNLHQADDKDIDAPEAWAITTGSRDIIVGIIDTGIGYDHEDLKDNIWQNPDESGDKRTTESTTMATATWMILEAGILFSRTKILMTIKATAPTWRAPSERWATTEKVL